MPQKAAAIGDIGVGQVVAIPFDAELAATPAPEFVRHILVRGLHARHVVVGYDFVFGHDREGNADLLRAMADAEGFGVSVVEAAATASGQIYSSSAVRDALREGRPGDAAATLGRWWSVWGTVEHGEARGAGIGFPTANLSLGEHLEPALGVYAVRARVAGGSWLAGVANVGYRPTFGPAPATCPGPPPILPLDAVRCRASFPEPGRQPTSRSRLPVRHPGRCVASRPPHRAPPAGHTCTR